VVPTLRWLRGVLPIDGVPAAVTPLMQFGDDEYEHHRFNAMAMASTSLPPAEHEGELHGVLRRG